jgi:hypothetical protein
MLISRRGGGRGGGVALPRGIGAAHAGTDDIHFSMCFNFLTSFSSDPAKIL